MTLNLTGIQDRRLRQAVLQAESSGDSTHIVSLLQKNSPLTPSFVDWIAQSNWPTSKKSLTDRIFTTLVNSTLDPELIDRIDDCIGKIWGEYHHFFNEKEPSDGWGWDQSHLMSWFKHELGAGETSRVAIFLKKNKELITSRFHPFVEPLFNLILRHGEKSLLPLIMECLSEEDIKKIFECKGEIAPLNMILDFNHPELILELARHCPNESLVHFINPDPDGKFAKKAARLLGKDETGFIYLLMELTPARILPQMIADLAEVYARELDNPKKSAELILHCLFTEDRGFEISPTYERERFENELPPIIPIETFPYHLLADPNEWLNLEVEIASQFLNHGSSESIDTVSWIIGEFLNSDSKIEYLLQIIKDDEFKKYLLDDFKYELIDLLEKNESISALPPKIIEEFVSTLSEEDRHSFLSQEIIVERTSTLTFSENGDPIPTDSGMDLDPILLPLIEALEKVKREKLDHIRGNFGIETDLIQQEVRRFLKQIPLVSLAILASDEETAKLLLAYAKLFTEKQFQCIFPLLSISKFLQYIKEDCENFSQFVQSLSSITPNQKRAFLEKFSLKDSVWPEWDLQEKKFLQDLKEIESMQTGYLKDQKIERLQADVKTFAQRFHAPTLEARLERITNLLCDESIEDEVGAAKREAIEWLKTISEAFQSIKSSVLDLKLSTYVAGPLEKYLDGITGLLMNDPVKFKDIDLVVDRTIIPGLQNTNPFTREPFDDQDLEPQVDLKAEIKAWKRTFSLELLPEKTIQLFPTTTSSYHEIIQLKDEEMTEIVIEFLLEHVSDIYGQFLTQDFHNQRDPLENILEFDGLPIAFPSSAEVSKFKALLKDQMIKKWYQLDASGSLGDRSHTAVVTHEEARDDLDTVLEESGLLAIRSNFYLYFPRACNFRVFLNRSFHRMHLIMDCTPPKRPLEEPSASPDNKRTKK